MKCTILAAAVLALFCACGSDESGNGDSEGDGAGGVDGGGIANGDPIANPQDFCDVMSEATCAKLMSCFTAQEREDLGLPADSEECLALEAGSCNPDNVCEDGGSYDAERAGACVVEYQTTSCETVRDPEAGPGEVCSAVCQ
jgi:hypothetical protein